MKLSTMPDERESPGCSKTFPSKIVYLLLLSLFGFNLSGCVIGYLAKSSYHQQKILRARVSIEKVLEDPKVDAVTKEKLKLAQSAKIFSEQKLFLNKTNNYSSFVQLDRPYVSWVIRVSKFDQVEAYHWWFPIVGSISYKGYFSEKEALEEAQTFSPDKFDTYVRGVTAYSTLGWFDDPIISPMLAYSPKDLVELIIHESVHATLYIKGSTDFNERLATFVARKGVRQFYIEKEGSDSATIKSIQKGQDDEQIFSEFITQEIESLKAWYAKKSNQFTAQEKEDRLNEIQERFKNYILPQLNSPAYANFLDEPLNNAKLLPYETYVKDLKDFELLYEKKGRDMNSFLQACKNLENSPTPEQDLKKLISQ